MTNLLRDLLEVVEDLPELFSNKKGPKNKIEKKNKEEKKSGKKSRKKIKRKINQEKYSKTCEK